MNTAPGARMPTILCATSAVLTLPLACVLSLGIIACGDDGSTEVANNPDASTTSPRACSDLAPATAGESTRSIMVSGVQRNYELSIPSDYDSTKEARLVFGWHGLGGSGAVLKSYTSVEAGSQSAPGNAASIFAYPDGLFDSQFGATAWTNEDAAFFDAVVAELSSELCIDESRIFSYGHSFGGYFSNVLGCLRGDSLRAIAPVAGGLAPGLGTCKSAMPAWLSHAADDNVVPLSEGITARDKWLNENQCAASTAAVAPTPCVEYSDCQSGARVVWCETTTGGHAWPAYANAAIWEFFAVFDTQNL